MLALLAGLLAWTLAEYLVHRFVLHRPRSRFWPSHLLHHREPLADVGVPFVVSVPLAGAAVALGGLPVLGFALGYAAYVAMHEGMHRLAIAPGHPLHGAKQRHDLHHRGFHANFGVTTPLWDVVFGIYRRG